MLKKATSFCLVGALVLSFATGIPAGAVDETVAVSDSSIESAPIEIMPMYAIIKNTSRDLSVSGSTASYQVTVNTLSSVKITATCQLQQKNTSGTYVNYGSSWSSSKTGTSLYTSGTKSVASGKTYRLKVTVKAGSETTTVYAYA